MIKRDKDLAEEQPQPVASEKRLSEPRIYANRLVGKSINTDKKYVFKKINGKTVRVEVDVRKSVMPTQTPISECLIPKSETTTRSRSVILSDRLKIPKMAKSDTASDGSESHVLDSR